MNEFDTENIPPMRRPVRKTSDPDAEPQQPGVDAAALRPHRPDSPPPSSARQLRLADNNDGATIPATPPPGLDATRVDAGINVDADGKFTIGAELGRGGMAVVHVARDRLLHRELAIKTLPDGSDERTRERFIEEAQITGQLQHPNIVPVHELGFHADGRPYLAMKRIVGRTFADTIAEAWRERRGRPLPQWPGLRRLLGVVVRICDAMAYAHSQGVIHRDLKPQNVMVGEFGDVLVVDWGLARPIGAEDVPASDDGVPPPETPRPAATRVISDRRSDSTQVTLPGTISGTPAYMSPEQAGGLNAHLDEGTDIFSLGAILYTVLTGHAPIEGGTVEQQLQAAVERRFLPPSRRVPRAGVPAELEAIVLRAMARRRRERYGAVADLRADIQAWLDDQLVSAARYGPVQRLAKWVRRHPTLTISSSLAGVFLALVAVGVIVWQQQVAAEKQKTQQAEQAAQVQEMARLQAEKQKLEAEQKALTEMAERAEWEELARHLGATIRRTRDQVLVEFYRFRESAKRSGISDQRMYATMSPEDRLRFLGAFDRLFAAHAADPQVVPVTAHDWYHRGMLRFVLRHDHRGALEDFTRAMEIDPTDVESYVARGIVWAELNELGKALEDLDEAVALTPQNPVAIGNRGVIRARSGRLEGALADFNRAIELDPGDPGPYVNRGNIHRMAGRLTDALADFTHALDLQPGYQEALRKRGEIHISLQRWDDARADLEQAVALAPDDWRSWMPLAGLRELAGDRQGAIAALRTAWRYCDDPPHREKMRRNFQRLGAEPE